MTRIHSAPRHLSPSATTPRAFTPHSSSETRETRPQTPPLYPITDGFDAPKGNLSSTSSASTAAATASKQQRELEKYLDKNGYVLDGNGAKSPLSKEQRDLLVKGLSKFPVAEQNRILASGIGFAIFDPKNPPPVLTNDGPELRGLSGVYDDAGKNLYFNSKLFSGEKSPVDPLDVIVHEAAHALDDLRRDDGDAKNALLASSNSPLVDKAFDAYNQDMKARLNEIFAKHPEVKKQAEKTGQLPYWVQQKVSETAFDGGYSGSNKGEFFAVGVEYYLGTKAQRAELKEKSPALFRYIENFLNARAA